MKTSAFSSPTQLVFITKMDPRWPLGEEGPRGYREQWDRQVPSVVDPPVHGDEALQRGLVLDVGIVEAGVQHDDGEGQDVARV